MCNAGRLTPKHLPCKQTSASKPRTCCSKKMFPSESRPLHITRSNVPLQIHSWKPASPAAACSPWANPQYIHHVSTIFPPRLSHDLHMQPLSTSKSPPASMAVYGLATMPPAHACRCMQHHVKMLYYCAKQEPLLLLQGHARSGLLCKQIRPIAQTAREQP